MKRQAYILIIILSLFAGKVAGQCVTVGSDKTVCQGSTDISLGGSVINGTTTVVWSGGGANGSFSDVNDVNSTWTPLSSYYGTVTLTLTSTAGCAQPIKFASLTITVLQTPTAGISGTASVCEGAIDPNITFTNTLSADVTITYNINVAAPLTIDVNASSTAIVAAPTTSAGSFVYNLVSVAYKTGTACSSSLSGSATITVNPVPGSISGTSNVCVGSNTAAFTCSPGGGSWYSSSPAIATVGASSGVVHGVAAGTCVISYVLPVTGCYSTTIVTVNPNVGTPVFALGTTSVRCQGAGTVTYTATATNNTGITYTLDATSEITNDIDAGTGQVTYVAGWSGTSIITATATGCNGTPAATHTVTINPSVVTPVFALGANSTRCQEAGNVTYTATATNNTGITYGLDSFSTSGGNSINTGTGEVTYVAGWSGTSIITVTATGCDGPKTASHAVTITPSVGTPVFTLGATSSRCEGAGTVTYTATATNNTGITYTLDATSEITNDIDAGTGQVNYVAGWSGTSIITATATGCNGTPAATHTVTITPSVSTPVFTLGATSTRCQGAGSVTYTATATTTTGITYTLDAASITGGNSIVAGTGAVTYVAGWSSTSVITASAPGCNGPTTATHTVTFNPVSAGGSIAGSTAVCSGTNSTTLSLSGNTGNVMDWQYSIDNWFTSGNLGNITSSQTATDLTATTKYRAVIQSGICSPTYSSVATVTVNPLPVPTITGPATPQRITSAANVFTTESGGTFGSGYLWAVSVDGQIMDGGGTANNTVTVKWNDTGPQTVSVNYTNANTCTATGATVYNVDVKPLPVASGVAISGTAEVGKLLAGSYTYTDGAGYDEGSSTYQWFRDVTSTISGANNETYTPVSADDGHTLSFEVTPVSSSGSPNTGTPVKSPATATVSSSGVPVASEVCIQGIRALGQTLTGKYKYTFAPKAEGTSTYKWLRDGVEITDSTRKYYVLGASDIGDNVLITFEVTPKSLPSVKTGLPVESYPLARFTMTEVTYSESIDTVFLTADPSGGIFSGPGVTNGIFSPAAVGVGTYTSQYQVIIANPSNSCSQQASINLTVTIASTSFSNVDDPICHDDAPFWVTVNNIPDNAEPYTYYDGYYDFGFYINDYYAISGNVGIVTEDLTTGPFLNGTTPQWKVLINPADLSVGFNVLYLYYYYSGYYYMIQKPLNIESVESVSIINNIDSAYCFDDPIQNITVDIYYPPGASATWTGLPILSHLGDPVAILNPASGTPGQSYPISYKYTSPNGCSSNVLRDTVTINPLPNPSFTLDRYYNIDGGADTLIASLPPGGSFIGSGVSGNILFPDIAGLGDHNITFKITDGNNCTANLTQPTTIRKAQGNFTGMPPVVCYSNTTYNISLAGLPSAIKILDFVNTKNSLVLAPDSLSASYYVPGARAGYDTLKFSYRWDDVNYTLFKTVFIDSIGKIAITGLKDNYCDYDGTATLRVLVENSTGNGNFSFSGPPISFTNYGNLADFFPSKAPPSATPYQVSYTHVSTVNNSGCSKTEIVPVTVSMSPSVSIVNTRTTVNIKEKPIVLSGTPSDGVFSGKGVYKAGVDYVFDPVVAGLGDIEITLSYTDFKGCSSSVKDTLVVSQASGTITGINRNNQYCYDGPDGTLIYQSNKPWKSGSFSGPGITNSDSTRAIFDPSDAGKGDHEIVFSYSDKAGTRFSISSTVNVDSLGQVVISNLLPGDVFCTNVTPFELFTSPKGGSFEGPVLAGSLDASKGLGETEVTYTYTNQRTGCSITASIPITIFPAPKVAFVPVDVCVENSTDSIRFINSTTSSDPIQSWLWEFSDVGGTSISGIKEPGCLFKSGGQHIVTLTATTTNDCSVRKVATVDLGIKPVADFYWKNECYQTNDSIMLFDTTFSNTPVVSRSWNFFDGGALLTGMNIKYPKKTTGYIPVQYIVKTNYANCSDTILKNIFIRPSVSLATDNYSQNFEDGNGGWIKGEETINSWSFGKPDRTIINSAASGNNAWFTGYSLTNQRVESSSITSPCFDFTTVDRPMIGLKLWRQFDTNRDGAALQYKIGDIGTWQYIGTLDDGINWFDSPLIKGRPGGDQLGWTSRDPDWIESRHTLDELKGSKNVKFRIAYGSDGTSENNDGIAVDDIWIGERTRHVLLEHFANTSSTKSSEATRMVNTIALANQEDVINIQYHSNFPGSDPFYDNNPGDASARILFYGLVRTPYSFIDGGTRKDYANIFDYVFANINSNDVTRRSLINPLFDISLNTTVSGGILSVTGKITALEDINSDNVTLYLAVTEKENNDHTGANGETIFYNVFRKFIPDAGGMNLKKTWTKGEAYTLPDQVWLIEKVLNSADIEVVAFVQNTITKELYQAASEVKHSIVVGIENLFQGKGGDFALYPNPAVNKITIAFEEPLVNDAEVRIYDIRGIVIASYKAASGLSEFTINNPGLRGGIYLVRVSVGGIDLGFRKLIISGD